MPAAAEGEAAGTVVVAGMEAGVAFTAVEVEAASVAVEGVDSTVVAAVDFGVVERWEEAASAVEWGAVRPAGSVAEASGAESVAAAPSGARMAADFAVVLQVAVVALQVATSPVGISADLEGARFVEGSGVAGAEPRWASADDREDRSSVGMAPGTSVAAVESPARDSGAAGSALASARSEETRSSPDMADGVAETVPLP